MARPRVDIDEDQVRKLAERQWSNVQIASFFDCDEGTIRRRFSEILAKGREKGKGYLRDLQWKAASQGNSTMLVWLGKQYLGQTEKNDQSISQQVVVMGEIKKDGEPLRYKIGDEATTEDTRHSG